MRIRALLTGLKGYDRCSPRFSARMLLTDKRIPVEGLLLGDFGAAGKGELEGMIRNMFEPKDSTGYERRAV